MIRGRTRSRELFPASLYASLLVAMVCLVRPEPARIVQRVCASAAALPLRAWNVVAPRRAEAAVDAADERRAGELSSSLAARMREALAVRPAGIADDLEPIPVSVIDRRRPGAGGVPAELVLPVSRQALDGCAQFVTCGDALVGFLAADGVSRRERPGAAVDPLAGLARVELLHCRPRSGLPRRVPSVAASARRGELHFLVEPAADIDRWPLRCDLLDDPYLAASLEDADLEVTTTGFRDDPLGALPAGLSIGWLRMFGYRVDGGRRVVPIGLFVQPRWPARALHHVVLWAPRHAIAAIAAAPRFRGSRLPVRLTRLPVPGEESVRLFATSAERALRPIPEDAAVVASGRLIGHVDAGGFGFGMVVPFGAPGYRWPLTLLPDAPDAPPIDLVAITRWRKGTRVGLELIEDSTAELADGQLFTGAGGPRLPGGLWIGPARSASPGEVIVEHLAADQLTRPAAVCDVAGAEGDR